MERSAISNELRDKLRWVKVSNRDIDLSHFPDFFIIGPQRTGTTWLHAQLRHHPEIFLAEPKELYFFSSLKTRDPKRFVSDELASYLAYFRDPIWRHAAKTALSLWKHRQPYAPHVRGEATASYAALDEDIVAEIAALNPGAKAILMIRDPIDRAWSHAKKDLLRNSKRRVDEVPEAEFRAFFTDPYQLRCAQYAEQYDRWSTQLRQGHVFTGFFDDIRLRPEELLLDVMRFLGVSADQRYIDREVRSAVNATEAAHIPAQYRTLLAGLFRDEAAKVNARFGRSW